MQLPGEHIQEASSVLEGPLVVTKRDMACVQAVVTKHSSQQLELGLGCVAWAFQVASTVCTVLSFHLLVNDQ